MTKWIGRELLVLAAVTVVIACATVPVTERRQLRLIPRSELLAMSFSQYDQFLSENPLISGTSEARMVERVGSRIAEAVQQYMSKIEREQDRRGTKMASRVKEVRKPLEA